MSSCPFCNHRSPLVENDLAYAVADKHPVTKGHTLVIPRRHVQDPIELTVEETRAVVELVAEVRALLDEEYRPDGYNIGVNIGRAAGQSVMHMHVHVIPRYIGDWRRPRGGVRGVIPDKQDY